MFYVINLIIKVLIKRLDATPKNNKKTRYFKERKINKIKDDGSFSVIINKIYINYF